MPSAGKGKVTRQRSKVKGSEPRWERGRQYVRAIQALQGVKVKKVKQGQGGGRVTAMGVQG